MTGDFQSLMSSFKSSIKTWDYFINWAKVDSNCANLEIQLNKLNYLLGKEDIATELSRLMDDSPDVIKALLILLAVRDKNLEVMDRATKNVENFDFNQVMDVNKIMRFLNKSKLISLFQKDGIKNLVDYVKGVEVGLDSNGRKNRGGTLMEDLVEESVAKFASERGYRYMAQATAGKMRTEYNINVAVNKSSRRFDFAIFNPSNGTLKLVETNFYNGGGSKLKAVCGEFQSLNDELVAQGIELIWITDGLGWHSAHLPLEEAYMHNGGRIYNLTMLENGALEFLTW